MKTNEKLMRLECFEIANAFRLDPRDTFAGIGMWKKARNISRRLFDFDVLCCGSTDRGMSVHISWFNKDGTSADFREGEPHYMREYYEKRGNVKYGGQYRDCGKVVNWDAKAKSFLKELNAFIEENNFPFKAELAGDMRYIALKGKNNTYSFID